MALVTLDVTITDVLACLAQFSTSNTTKPTANITSKWINLSAAKVNDAARHGGYPLSSVDSTDEPEAYYILQDLIAELAALIYLRKSGTFNNSKDAQGRWDEAENMLERLRRGDTIGELGPSNGARTCQLSLGDDSVDDLDDYRVTYDEEL